MGSASDSITEAEHLLTVFPEEIWQRICEHISDLGTLKELRRASSFYGSRLQSKYIDAFKTDFIMRAEFYNLSQEVKASVDFARFISAALALSESGKHPELSKCYMLWDYQTKMLEALFVDRAIIEFQQTYGKQGAKLLEAVLPVFCAAKEVLLTMIFI